MRKGQQKVVAACADTMFPPGGPIAVSGTEAGLVAYVAAYAAALPWLRRFLVWMLFLFIQLSPFVFGPRRARFTRLSPDERLIVLQQMAVSATYFRRVSFLSMRAIMTMGYFACPRVTARIMRVPDNDVQLLDEV
jgi:hypothetical protein